MSTIEKILEKIFPHVEKTESKPEIIAEKYDRAMEVAEFILDLYPEIDKTKRDVWDFEREDRKSVDRNGVVTHFGWNDDAMVHIGKSGSGHIECAINLGYGEKISDWDKYNISATIDYWNGRQDLIEKRLRERNISDKRDLGLISIDVYDLDMGFGQKIEEKALMDLFCMTLAYKLAFKYDVEARKTETCCGDYKHIEFSMDNLQENSLKSIVEAVKKYRSIASLPEFKSIMSSTAIEVRDNIRKLILLENI